MQTQVLDIGAGLVKPGGRLVYIVCSLLDTEGSGQVAAFLSRHPGWSAEPIESGIGTPHGPGRRLDPATHGTDGFFVACLRAPC
jgi:16S rRNA (cytosine967-C5)-methyltransferase